MSDKETAFEWDEDAPLERQTGESKTANEAFRDYARMGVRRSLRRLLAHYRELDEARDAKTDEKPPTTSWSTINNWNHKFDWNRRAGRFDELEAEAKDRLWEERRVELLEADWNQGKRLREVAQEFIDQFPRFIRQEEQVRQVRREDGTVETVRLITVGLNATLSQIASMVKTASDLQRLAANEPTDDLRLSGAALDALLLREIRALAEDYASEEGDDPWSESGEETS